jgi:hypothetical protein
VDEFHNFFTEILKLKQTIFICCSFDKYKQNYLDSRHKFNRVNIIFGKSYYRTSSVSLTSIVKCLIVIVIEPRPSGVSASSISGFSTLHDIQSDFREVSASDPAK